MSGTPVRPDVSAAALAAYLARHAGADRAGACEAGPPVRVERLDRPGAYWLVPVRDGAGLRGLVQIDAGDLSVESSAAIRDPAAVVVVTGEEALDAARAAFPGRTGWGLPFLGWRPCRETSNSMRPLWVVPWGDDRVYVTQGGKVIESLTSGPGG